METTKVKVKDNSVALCVDLYPREDLAWALAVGF